MGNRHNLNICKQPDKFCTDAELPPLIKDSSKKEKQVSSKNKQKVVQTFIFQNQEFFTLFPTIALVLVRDAKFSQQLQRYKQRTQTDTKVVYYQVLQKNEPTVNSIQHNARSSKQNKKNAAQRSTTVQKIQLIKSQKLFKMGQFNPETGQLQGYGLMIDQNGLKYRGNFQNGEFSLHGEQESFYPKRKYIGQWKSGLKHGYGQYFYEDGATYQGNFQNGQKSGDGKLTFQDESVYQGQFSGDLMHGQGTLTTQKGEQTTGQWSMGRLVSRNNDATSARISRTFSINSTLPYSHNW